MMEVLRELVGYGLVLAVLTQRNGDVECDRLHRECLSRDPSFGVFLRMPNQGLPLHTPAALVWYVVKEGQGDRDGENVPLPLGQIDVSHLRSLLEGALRRLT